MGLLLIEREVLREKQGRGRSYSRSMATTDNGLT